MEEEPQVRYLVCGVEFSAVDCLLCLILTVDAGELIEEVMRKGSYLYSGMSIRREISEKY